MSKPGGDLSASNLRLVLAMIAPREASALWAQPGVISEMNTYFTRALLAATEDEREACAQRVLSYAGEAGEHNAPPEIRHLTGIVRAIRKRGEP